LRLYALWPEEKEKKRLPRLYALKPEREEKKRLPDLLQREILRVRTHASDKYAHDRRETDKTDGRAEEEDKKDDERLYTAARARYPLQKLVASRARIYPP
jgi:hypothetical protein